MALGMQLFRAEVSHVDLWALVAPIWFMGFPVLVMVAAMGVLFESIPFLSGSFGNAAYFFLYLGMLPLFISQTTETSGIFQPSGDFFGMSHPVASMQKEILTYDPNYAGNMIIIGWSEYTDDLLIFPWQGITWTFRIFLERLTWIGVALMVVLAAILPFDRFDPARRGIRKRDKTDDSTGTERKRRGLFRRRTVITASNIPGPVASKLLHDGQSGLTPLTGHTARWRFLSVVSAELRMALKGRAWWWYAGYAGFFLVAGIVPSDTTLVIVFLSWIWPLRIWSMMGARDIQFFTGSMVNSAPHPIRRQLAATWLTGACVALLPAGGALLRLLFSGETEIATLLLGGVLLIPSLALALGSWSGTPRLFEIIYLMIWYGLFNGIGGLQFKSAVPETKAGGILLVSLAFSLVLIIMAAVGKWRTQLQ